MSDLRFRNWLVQESEQEIARVKLRDGTKPFSDIKVNRQSEKSRLKEKIFSATSNAEMSQIVDEILSKGYTLRGKRPVNDVHKWLLEHWLRFGVDRFFTELTKVYNFSIS